MEHIRIQGIQEIQIEMRARQTHTQIHITFLTDTFTRGAQDKRAWSTHKAEKDHKRLPDPSRKSESQLRQRSPLPKKHSAKNLSVISLLFGQRACCPKKLPNKKVSVSGSCWCATKVLLKYSRKKNRDTVDCRFYDTETTMILGCLATLTAVCP